jgi:hypothetical protein
MIINEETLMCSATNSSNPSSSASIEPLSTPIISNLSSLQACHRLSSLVLGTANHAFKKTTPQPLPHWQKQKRPQKLPDY